MDSRFDADRITYLQMIQDIITRISNISVTFKGLAATIFAGALSIAVPADSPSRRIALLFAAVVIVVLFCFCDCGYLLREKHYRRLYDEVRIESHECDFDLSINKACWHETLKCLSSFSICLYYGALILALSAAIILSAINVI